MTEDGIVPAIGLGTVNDGFEYKGYRVEYYLSKEPFVFRREELIAYHREIFKSKPDDTQHYPLVNFRDKTTKALVMEKGYYVNKRMYVSYVVDGVLYENVLIDKVSIPNR